MVGLRRRCTLIAVSALARLELARQLCGSGCSNLAPTQTPSPLSPLSRAEPYELALGYPGYYPYLIQHTTMTC